MQLIETPLVTTFDGLPKRFSNIALKKDVVTFSVCLVLVLVLTEPAQCSILNNMYLIFLLVSNNCLPKRIENESKIQLTGWWRFYSNVCSLRHNWKARQDLTNGFTSFVKVNHKEVLTAKKMIDDNLQYDLTMARHYNRRSWLNWWDLSQFRSDLLER